MNYDSNTQMNHSPDFSPNLVYTGHRPENTGHNFEFALFIEKNVFEILFYKFVQLFAGKTRARSVHCDLQLLDLACYNILKIRSLNYGSDCRVLWIGS